MVPKVQRRDYTVALDLTGTQIEDPDAMLYENDKCGGVCWGPKAKNLTVMVDSIYNGWRMGDVWLDQ